MKRASALLDPRRITARRHSPGSASMHDIPQFPNIISNQRHRSHTHDSIDTFYAPVYDDNSDDTTSSHVPRISRRSSAHTPLASSVDSKQSTRHLHAMPLLQPLAANDYDTNVHQLHLRNKSAHDNVNHRLTRSNSDEDTRRLLLDNDTSSSLRATRWYAAGRGFRDIMLTGIPSNWAELCGFLIFMALVNIGLRISVHYTQLPADQNAFTPAQLINNLSMLLHYSSSSYMLGTISLADVCTLFYFCFMIASSIIFTFMSTLSFFHNSLAPDSVRTWGPLAIAGYSCIFTLMLLALVYQVLVAWRYSRSYFAIYVSALSLMIILHGLLFMFLEDGVHVHHWYFAWIFLLTLRSRSRLSILSHAIATGVFQQGIAAYGCAPVIYNGGLT